MQLDEFKFIYDDFKQQLKEIPPLQKLLTLTEKSTKKLECHNLYALTDRKDFDIELEDQQIMEDILQLYMQVKTFKNQPSQESYADTNTLISKIKEKYMEIFDLLNKQEEILTQEIELTQYFIDEEHHEDQIKEVDEYDEEPKEMAEDRTDKLKREIDEINEKIKKINTGRGKWFSSDHQDFIKIYNKCRGNDKKILAEGVKILGMKNTEIMDHLEVYQTFLQLEKEKKIVFQEYKQIKAMEKIEKDQQKYEKDLEKKQKQRLKNQKKAQENIKKKELVQKFKQEQIKKKAKMIEEQEKKIQQRKITALNAKKRVEAIQSKKIQSNQQDPNKKKVFHKSIPKISSKRIEKK